MKEGTVENGRLVQRVQKYEKDIRQLLDENNRLNEGIRELYEKKKGKEREIEE